MCKNIFILSPQFLIWLNIKFKAENNILFQNVIALLHCLQYVLGKLNTILIIFLHVVIFLLESFSDLTFPWCPEEEDTV
jgi:hypothetical protein